MKGSIYMIYMVGVVVYGLFSEVLDIVGNFFFIFGGFLGINVNIWNNEIYVYVYGLWI